MEEGVEVEGAEEEVVEEDEKLVSDATSVSVLASTGGEETSRAMEEGAEVEGAEEDGAEEDDELVSLATSVCVFASTGREETS
jgi:hypothetical protein